eukprot:366456-Chlamydomonas_euryale.AAC.13
MHWLADGIPARLATSTSGPMLLAAPARAHLVMGGFDWVADAAQDQGGTTVATAGVDVGELVAAWQGLALGLQALRGYTLERLGEDRWTACLARLHRACAGSELLGQPLYEGVVHGRGDHHIVRLGLRPTSGQRCGPGRRPVRTELLAWPAAAPAIAAFVQDVLAAARLPGPQPSVDVACGTHQYACRCLRRPHHAKRAATSLATRPAE